MKQSLNEVLPKKYAIVDTSTGAVLLEFNDYNIAMTELNKLKIEQIRHKGSYSVAIKPNTEVSERL